MTGMTRQLAMANVSTKQLIRWLALVLLLLAQAAAGGPSKHHVQLRIIVSNPRLCVGAKEVPLEAVLANAGETAASVYRSGIYEFTFTKQVHVDATWKVDAYQSRKDISTGDPALHESPVSLPPNSSVIFPIKYNFSSNFFGEPGTYSVRVRYTKIPSDATAKDAFLGGAESNEALFELNDCR